jgi:hypothetical protein
MRTHEPITKATLLCPDTACRLINPAASSTKEGLLWTINTDGPAGGSPSLITGVWNAVNRPIQGGGKDGIPEVRTLLRVECRHTKLHSHNSRVQCRHTKLHSHNSRVQCRHTKLHSHQPVLVRPA